MAPETKKLKNVKIQNCFRFAFMKKFGGKKEVGCPQRIIYSMRTTTKTLKAKKAIFLDSREKTFFFFSLFSSFILNYPIKCKYVWPFSANYVCHILLLLPRPLLLAFPK